MYGSRPILRAGSGGVNATNSSSIAAFPALAALRYRMAITFITAFLSAIVSGRSTDTFCPDLCRAEHFQLADLSHVRKTAPSRGPFL